MRNVAGRIEPEKEEETPSKKKKTHSWRQVVENIFVKEAGQRCCML